MWDRKSHQKFLSREEEATRLNGKEVTLIYTTAGFGTESKTQLVAKAFSEQ